MSLPDPVPTQTSPNRQALKLLDLLIKQVGLTRKELLDRLAELGIVNSENDLKNWGRPGRSFQREVLRPMIRVLVEARAPTDPKRCTALQALEFLGLAGLPGHEFSYLASLFPPEEFNAALKSYFQIDLSANEKEHIEAVPKTVISNEPADLTTISNSEASIYHSNLNNNDDFHEVISTGTSDINQIHIRTIREKAKLTIVIALTFMLMIIVIGIAISGRLRSVASISYPRGSVPIASAANPHALNPVLTCDAGEAIDSSCALDENTRSLILTAGGHTIIAKEKGNNEHAPVVLLPVFGDFTAQVTVAFQPDSVCCKHAGIGVRSTNDINSWIRISRDHADTIQLDGLSKERTTNSSVPNYTSDRVWFRIERRGDLFTLSYSSDGANWISLRKDYEFLLPKDTQLFLFAYSAYQQDVVSAEFSNLSVK